MWLRDGDRAIQSLNFQGFCNGMTAWMHPRFSPSMLGVQPDMYQAMASAALQEMRAADYSKQASSAVMPFQQAQNISGSSGPPLASHILQQIQSQPQQTLQNYQENHNRIHSPYQLIQHQSQHGSSFNDEEHGQISALQQQEQKPQVQQIQKLQSPNLQISNVMSTVPQFTNYHPQTAPMQTMASFCQQQNVPDSNINSLSGSSISPLQGVMDPFSPEESSSLLSLRKTNPVLDTGAWSSKRHAVESVPSAIQSVQSQPKQLGQQISLSQHVALPPFPERDCSLIQESGGNSRMNIESSSLLVQNGMANETVSALMPFLSSAGTDFALHQALTSSTCVEDSEFFHSPSNVGSVNPQNGTFVKVNNLQFA